MTLLSVSGLRTVFRTSNGDVAAVDGVDISVDRGGTLGIVGESGCGKSVLSLSVMRLVPPPGRIAAGQIQFDGKDLLQLSPAQMRDIRGNRIAMIFQEPMTSLNPVFTVGDQITEAMRAHDRTASATSLRSRAIAALQRVRIPAPERRFDEYPHQMSGGMRQRVAIAIALSCAPRLLIADEPTTALDVTVQAQILELLARERRGDLQQDSLGDLHGPGRRTAPGGGIDSGARIDHARARAGSRPHACVIGRKRMAKIRVHGPNSREDRVISLSAWDLPPAAAI